MLFSLLLPMKRLPSLSSLNSIPSKQIGEYF
jgi:hypothetical protein